MPADLFRFGEFELDQGAYELRRSGQSVRLERIPFELLNLLVERRGQLVSREQIIERLWGKGVYHDTEHGINTAVRKIRLALQDDSDSPRFILTVPAKGYRFVAPVERVTPGINAESAPTAETQTPGLTKTRNIDWRTRVLIPATALMVVSAAAAFFYFRRVQILSETDTLVIADFNNTTGETVFDDTLKQALAVQISQSPFLNILSDERMSETLGLMGHPKAERVNEKTALEVCRRTQGAAALAGSIATVGSQYVLGLNAVACRTGNILVQEQLRVNSREEVLKGIDRVATKLRKRLGESAGTIEKFDVPIEQATTTSLEALQAYSLGRRSLMAGDMNAAATAFQSAVMMDPDFAMAHVMLGSTYANLGAGDLASEHTNKAYGLRAQVSERERFYIESHYHMFVTGSIEKQRQALELWAQVYPRDYVPPFNLGAMYGNIGQFDKALAETQESLRLDPDSTLEYATLAYFYLALNRFADAHTMIEEARTKKSDSPELHITAYLTAFARNDEPGMQREVTWATTNHQLEDFFFAMQADTAAYSGKLHAAREFSRRAVNAAQVAGATEAIANYYASSAVRESLFGNLGEGTQHAKEVLAATQDGGLVFLAGLAMALAGDTAHAQKVSNELAVQRPENTMVQYLYLPAIRAQLSLIGGNPANAIQELKTAAPYELGAERGISLYPIYVRGKAYLAAHQGTEAAAEFQKILGHRGVVLMGPIGALAHLEIARAFTMQGDKASAKAAYQDFLTLWKDADSELPVLIAAKAEYAELQ